MNKEGSEMLKVEKYFSGSLGINIIEDDPTCRNYLALYCCLVGIERKGKKVIPRIDSMLSEFGVKSRCKRPHNNKLIRLINVKTGEVKEFKSIDSTACFLGLKQPAVSHILKRKTPSRSGWRAEYIK
ncbi:TPA: hypothetical protein KRI65_000525 [Clostridioides difficile]|uniref:NUMOD1 domain protein n=2 Tax=Clostridioides difficile TaxID=1496 RepID=D5Q3Y3_CLODI|nr:hypothetical protein C4E42_02465 [Clostridioides difficile]EFH07303.1 hypothetical protein HMPREF0220_1615 [Clostridioides difficile NAP08]EFH15659.1 hypothetical protein HMPREF0219_1782 [Clostridioides difficile NAP07]CCK87253.1 conserved hypothetical protein [Clostridioides difficile T5]CCK94354.1 conserved hypothetical protein [Clostridioides difficile E1]CCL00171.1 conserved hypothetical protein [Clostridioides difficile E10]